MLYQMVEKSLRRGGGDVYDSAKTILFTCKAHNLWQIHTS